MTVPVPPEAITAILGAGRAICHCGPDYHDYDCHLALDEKKAQALLAAAALVLRDHWAKLLKAEIADEVTAITAETVIEAVALSTARIRQLESDMSELLIAYSEAIGSDLPPDVAADLARWEATCRGEES